MNKAYFAQSLRKTGIIYKSHFKKIKKENTLIESHWSVGDQ